MTVGLLSFASTPVVANGLIINLSYDASVSSAPAGWTNYIQQAVTILQNTFTQTPVTVNIIVSYGLMYKQPGVYDTVPSNSSEGTDLAGNYLTYTAIRAALAAASSKTTNLANFVNSLPTGPTLDGTASFYVPPAVEKALGLNGVSPTRASLDGTVGIGTGIGTSVLVGVALHEITHAMGREVGGTPLDFARFTSAGTRLYTSAIPAPAAYFSIDGGATKLADFGKTSDPSDFLNSGVQDSGLPGGDIDPFDEFYAGAGTPLQNMTTVGTALMNCLGFQ